MRLRLTAIESYVLGLTLLSVAGATAILSSVILLIDFVDVAGRMDLTFTETVGFVALKSPAVIVLVLPFMVLFGTLAAFVGLNRRSELVAMRAAGLSAWRFIMPAAAAAGIFGFMTVTVLDPLTGGLNDRFERAMIADRQNQEIWLRQGDERIQTVIHARGLEAEGADVTLIEPVFFDFEIRPDGVQNFQRRIQAERATLQVGAWNLTNVMEAAPGVEVLEYETMSLPTLLSDRRDIERFTTPSAISIWDLPRVIEQTEQAGFSGLGYRLRLQRLLATPLLFAAMSILAAAFSLKLIRLGGLALLATSGVALGFVFFFLNEFAGALGQAEIIPVFAAAWAPPVLALLSGLTLLMYTEDG
jgi:lipopolysaccharide export system permease protein